MLFIAEGKNNSNIHYKYGNSLFGYINPKGRNCTKFKDEISKKNLILIKVFQRFIDLLFLIDFKNNYL